ncbi:MULTISPECIES: tyrosine-protein phosphatase [unclassified Exiguobacterium]|uniref:tyrosine-protein phosphatase n=1 Tax=unclassified Exiguobacterium TaxID=2644629 RepID=UPI00103EC414|nr:MULTISPECIES: CpsB/CapC family capsule biosynthesis tyrosine phosphatase [unclassified Exiguobacterium]TCI58790.1 protein tyrosine phosphatase [Exiguobacterium sp. SH3S1]
MIDIHCHLLPAVDDGPETVEQAVEMAKRAASEGVTAIVVTPHAFHPQFETDELNVQNAVAKLQDVLRQEGIALDLYAGQEIRVFGELVEALEQGKALSLAGSRYVLVEFPSDSVPAYAEQLFFGLQTEGYTPVIAHPERNKEFATNPKRLMDFVSSGALSQITTGSLTGEFGQNVQDLAFAFLRNGLSHLIASDAHSTGRRTFYWDDAKDAVTKELGADKWDTYVGNAEAVMKDEFVFIDPPILPIKNWRGKWKK